MYEIRSYIGTRKVQEDAADCCMNEKGLFAVVCDGIGSKSQGGASSQMAVRRFIEIYKNEYNRQFPRFVSEAAKRIDKEVNENYGTGCGTTAVAVYIKEYELNWLSVGDSRLYIIRDGRMKQITTDHNYRYVLELRKQKNIIDEDTYYRELKKADRLASFIGMGEIDIVDVSVRPLLLRNGDKILVTTDGLYKSLTEKTIYDIIRTGDDPCITADKLIATVKHCETITDNTTFVLIYI